MTRRLGKRLLLTTPRPGCEVGESSAAAARQPGPTMAHRVDYSFVDTIETRFRDTERRMMTALEMVNMRLFTRLEERETCSEASEDGRPVRPWLGLKLQQGNRCTVQCLETEGLNALHESALTMEIHEVQNLCISMALEGVVYVNSNGLKGWETIIPPKQLLVENQIYFYVYSLAVLLTWWNSHVMTVTHDVAYAMTWVDLRKKMTDKYCPRNEMKKLEAELWNLKVIASKAKNMQEAVEMATELMDKRVSTIAERQAEKQEEV
ncbi:hypothetical protein Tco_1314443 [Tanacetum coccineum]